MRCCLAIGLGGILLVSVVNSVSGQTPSPTFTSCAWVRAENDAAGTGFVLDSDKKLLVTCRHLVADRAKIDVIFPWFRDGELVSDRHAYLGNRLQLRELGLLVTGKVLKTSDELDLALVELESLPTNARAVTFAQKLPSPGESLHVIGNRLDLDTVWNLTTGPVRTTGRLSEGYFWRGKKLAVNAAAIIGQLPTEEGDSGGPVFNTRRQLVGMASALRRQCPLAAVAISATEIRKFAGLPVPPVDEKSPRSSEVVESLMRATVWVHPAATDIHLAGVLIEKDLVLTCGKSLTRGDRVGVAFPIREENRWVCERTAYKDSVELALRGCWRSGVVLARDLNRDLALIRLDSSPNSTQPIRIATRSPNPGNNIHAMNHPSGLEFAWVYSSGSVRQRGKIAIAPGESAKRISTIVCQLPAQAGSPGGPVLNDKGELAGVLTAKESTQQVGYAVAVEEIASFLDIVRMDRPPETLNGLMARIENLPHQIAVTLATGLARQGEENRAASHFAEAKRDCDKAVSLDPDCVQARLCRAKMLDTELALAELDSAVEKGSFDRNVLFLRAELSARTKDWRKARGDLERIVDVNPLDAEARQRLIGPLLELNEDEKALAAVADALRADPKRMSALAVDLLTQADTLAKKFPDAPAIPTSWLLKTLAASEKAIGDPKTKGRLAALLKRAGETKDDAERLVLLRQALKSELRSIEPGK